MKKINENGKISLVSKLSYGMGEMPFGIVNTIISVYLLITLTDYLNVPPIWASVIVFAGIIWDAITDPVAGWLSDNSGGRFGRRRRYILAFCIPLGISFILLWLAPVLLVNLGAGQTAVKILTITVLYFLVILFLTLINIPFGSVIMEMTDDYNERTSLTSFRMVCSAIATLGAIFIADTIMGDGAIYETGGRLYLIGIVFGIFVIIAALLCFLGTFERRKFEKPLKRQKFNFTKYFLKSWKSPSFRQITIAYLCAFTVIGLLQTLLQYYTTYWLRAPELFVVLAGGVLVLAILSTPLWSFLSSKFGKRNTFLIACSVAITGLIVIFFVPQMNLGADFKDLGKSIQGLAVQAYIGVFLLGVGVGGVQLLPFSMMPDAINVSMKDGDADEGAYYGVVNFVQKVGMGIATLLIGPILQFAGYINPPGPKDPGYDANTLFPQNNVTNQTIRAMFVGLSIIIIVIGALAVLKYRVDKKALQAKTKSKEEVNKEDKISEEAI